MTTAMIAAAARATNSPAYSSLLFAELGKVEPVLVDAHAKAYRAMKAVRGDLQVGVTLTMQDVQGVGPGNPAELVQKMLYGPWLEAAAKSDFIGVQTYTRVRVGAQGAMPPPDGAEMTAAGYEFYPEALIGTIKLAATTGKPVFVTESGIATEDDTRRIAFIDRALAAVRVAIDAGIDVRSYIHWSLLDNFEWTSGYAQHFGLVAVDRTTFKRTPKPSAYHLGRRAKANRI
jgi:beta-glucosidase